MALCSLQLTDPPLSLKPLPAHCSPLYHVYISVFPSQHSAHVVIFSGPALWSVEPCLRCKMNTGRAPQKTHYETICRMAQHENTQKHFMGERTREEQWGQWSGKKRCSDFTRQSNLILKPYTVYSVSFLWTVGMSLTNVHTDKNTYAFEL